MKAIKLASVFAVSAVAVAVSTATFAAEPVFKGTAGLEYKSQESGSDAAGSRGEVNIIGDTGLVYFDLDMEKNSVVGEDSDGDAKTYTDGGFDLDEIYVKVGAVQFGDFDGSIVDDAAFSAGVEEDNDVAKSTFGDDLGVRYMVNDNLTVALEVTEGENVGTLAVNYSVDMEGFTLGLSGGYKMSDDDLADQIVTAGVKVPMGMATLTAFVQTGSKADADIANTGVGLDLGLTEELSVALQYYGKNGEKSKGTDEKDAGNMEATVYYTAGDLTYYASYVDQEAKDADYSVVGVKASF